MSASHEGLCAACGRTFTVDAAHSQLAKHGYVRPWGLHLEKGRCHGAYRLPHQLSPEVARECLQAMNDYRLGHRLHLEKLERGDVRSVHEGVWSRSSRKVEQVERTLVSGPHFVRAIAETIHVVRACIEQCELEIRRLETLLQDWKPEPMRAIVARKEASYQCCVCHAIKSRSELIKRRSIGRSYQCAEPCKTSERKKTG